MKIAFKFDALDGVAGKLDKAAARGRYALAASEAVNLVVKRAEDSLIRGELRDINLSVAYVKSKTDLVLAVPGSKASASITTKGDATVMSNFGVTMGSMRRGGNPTLRAGPRAGRRNAGTDYAIRKSAAGFEAQWFVLPLLRGKLAGGNGFGVFVRDDRLAPSKIALREGKAGKRQIYGPAPYQLFKAQLLVQSDDIRDDLERTALDRFGRELEEALA